MTRVCSICSHPKRLQIDRALASGRTKEGIAREFGVGPDALRAHTDAHLSRQLVQALQRKETMEANQLLAGIEDLLSRTKNILTIAEDKHRYHLALSAIKEGRGCYELLSKIAFALHSARQLELQTEERRYAASANSSGAEFAKLLCDRLTLDELNLWQQLAEKIRGNTNAPIVLDRAPSLAPEPVLDLSASSGDSNLSGALTNPPASDEPLVRRRTKFPSDRFKVQPIPATPIPDGSDLPKGKKTMFPGIMSSVTVHRIE